PICTECMTMAPVGIRCPEHSGRAQGVQRMTRGVQRAAFEGAGAKVTRTLVGLNVGVYIAELATGGGINGVNSTIYEKGVLVSGRAGSAGALLLDPLRPTVGASGAIFGVLGAGFVLERQRDYVFGGSALGVIVLNLVFTLSFSNSISVGGHIGGLIGGAACALGMTRLGRVGAAYGRPGALGVAAMLLVGVASVLIAYWKAR